MVYRSELFCAVDDADVAGETGLAFSVIVTGCDGQCFRGLMYLGRGFCCCFNLSEGCMPIRDYEGAPSAVL